MKVTPDSLPRARARFVRPLLTFACATLLGAASLTAATLTFTPSKDVMAKAKFPDTNFGADPLLQVSNQTGFQKIIYLQFTVAGIPAGSTGISASLKLRSQTTDTHTIAAHSVASTSWGETTLTWTNKPALGTGTLSSVAANNSGQDSVWNVSSHVTGNGTFALGLDTANSGDTSFSSKEGANAPQLVVTYTPPTTYNIYKGNTHAHTYYTVSHGDHLDDNGNLKPDWQNFQGPPADHHTRAKAAGSYDFYVTTDHSQEVTFDPTNVNDAEWVDTKNQAANQTTANYVGLAGYEHSDNNGPGGTGHINVVNSNAYLDALESGIDLPFLYNWLKTAAANTQGGSGPVVASFNHPGSGQYGNWGNRDAQITDIVTMLEVINQNDNIHEVGFNEALNAGWKVSPVCGNDNHGFWGITNHTSRTFVLATARTKTAILDAMKNRRTYASLEGNLSASYTVNGAIMGSTLSSPTTLNFAITVSDPDTADKITKIEICKADGADVDTDPDIAASATFNSNSVTWNPTITDTTNKWFYVRIYNATGGDAGTANPAKPVAWLAPIWTGR